MNSRPGILVAAVVIVFVQSFFNLAAGVLGLVEIAVLEGFSVIGGLVTIVSGAPQAVVGIAMAVVVLVLLFNSQTTVWFIQVRAARSVY